MDAYIFPCCSPFFKQLTQSKGSVPIVPVVTRGSHDSTRVPTRRCRSGRLAVFPPRDQRRVKTEALKGAQQVEAIVLAFGLRMNELRQLAGERHFPSGRPQVV